MLKHPWGHCGLAKAPKGIFCSPATVMGEGQPLSHTHLNLLIGDVIVHHAGRVWPVVLGGARPPAGGGMGSSFPGHPCRPPSEPFHLRGLPALISQLHSRALYPTLLYPTLPHISLKSFISIDETPPLPILPDGNCPTSGATKPWGTGSPCDHNTNHAPALACSREHTGLRITIPSPALCPGTAPSQPRCRRTALQVGVPHSRHYVGNCLHIHVVVVQGLRCRL